MLPCSYWFRDVSWTLRDISLWRAGTGPIRSWSFSRDQATLSAMVGASNDLGLRGEEILR